MTLGEHRSTEHNLSCSLAGIQKSSYLCHKHCCEMFSGCAWLKQRITLHPERVGAVLAAALIVRATHSPTSRAFSPENRMPFLSATRCSRHQLTRRLFLPPLVQNRWPSSRKGTNLLWQAVILTGIRECKSHCLNWPKDAAQAAWPWKCFNWD